MPEDEIARIGKLADAALNSRVVREKLSAQLMQPITGSAADFRARIESDIERWTPVIAAAKIKID